MLLPFKYIKKFISLILVLFILCGCNLNNKTDSKNEKYYDLISILSTHTNFAQTSNFFSIQAEIAKTNNAYRYYVTIDNPKNAMYGIEAVAIEKGVNYSLNMAANIGIFEDTEYNMIPGQSDTVRGYATGINISGTTKSPNTTIYVLVQWYSRSQEIHQEFFELKVECELEDE